MLYNYFLYRHGPVIYRGWNRKTNLGVAARHCSAWFSDHKTRAIVYCKKNYLMKDLGKQSILLIKIRVLGDDGCRVSWRDTPNYQWGILSTCIKPELPQRKLALENGINRYVILALFIWHHLPTSTSNYFSNFRVVRYRMTWKIFLKFSKTSVECSTLTRDCIFFTSQTKTSYCHKRL